MVKLIFFLIPYIRPQLFLYNVVNGLFVTFVSSPSSPPLLQERGPGGEVRFLTILMNDNLDPTGSNLSPAEKEVEKVLRPHEFQDFSGQENIIENLKIFVQAAKQRKEPLDHVLL